MVYTRTAGVKAAALFFGFLMAGQFDEANGNAGAEQEEGDADPHVERDGFS